MNLNALFGPICLATTLVSASALASNPLDVLQTKPVTAYDWMFSNLNSVLLEQVTYGDPNVAHCRASPSLDHQNIEIQCRVTDKYPVKKAQEISVEILASIRYALGYDEKFKLDLPKERAANDSSNWYVPLDKQFDVNAIDYNELRKLGLQLEEMTVLGVAVHTSNGFVTCHSMLHRPGYSCTQDIMGIPNSTKLESLKNF